MSISSDCFKGQKALGMGAPDEYRCLKYFRSQRKAAATDAIGQIGVPDDIAKAVIWLTSDHSDHVNGATLYVDGEKTLHPGFEGSSCQVYQTG